ncbi:MAG: 50S ribosomal protein L25 [Kiritimatiellae bacterium]|jgi:large subunit ribosomal protein L25|nr:50S ribosomal protein L25 [Kiritimatiellia bacterium]
MAKEEIKLKAELRVAQGSKAAGRLRRVGMIPAAVNRIGGDTTLVKFDAHTFEGMLRHHTSEHFIVKLDLDGEVISTLMREVQHNVMTGDAIHVDLGEVSLTDKIHVTIPVKLFGEPKGVRVSGGILEHLVREVEVACLPNDVVEKFEIDTSELQIGQALRVRDLNIGDKYTLYTDLDKRVAIVVNPAAEEVEETAEAAEAESAAVPAPETA